MRDRVPASTSLLIASRGMTREAISPRFIFHWGTTTFTFKAGLETMKRLLLGSLAAMNVDSIAAPPNEWPSGTTSPSTCLSTSLTKATMSSLHWDHASTWPRWPWLWPWPRKSTANVPFPLRAIPAAKSLYRPACSPSPWATAKVIFAPGCGHARKAIRVPSREPTVPAAVAVSATEMAKAAQDLQRLLLRFEQGRRIGADSVQRVGPFGARRALRVQPEGRRVEQD